MKPQLFLLAILLAAALSVSAQVSINTDGSAPPNSAMLEVKSTSRGVLLPRMTNAERDAITDPATGLIIYNIEEQMIQFYNGTTWWVLGLWGCLPATPDTIYGNSHPECNANGIVFSVADIPWASSYNWTIYPEAEITSGQGTNSITVDFGLVSGQLSVRAQSGCGNSEYKILPIIIDIPTPPASILGNSHPECNAEGIVYHVDPVPGATNYHWLIYDNATITSGQGTSSIMVNFGTENGEMSVRAQSSCGNSDYTALSYTIGIPDQPGNISGPTTPYKNSAGNIYSIDPPPGATNYHWTVPSDAVIIDGQGTTSITVTVGVQNGNVSVRAENSCGNTSYTDLPVTPFACGDVVTDIRDSHTYPTVQIGTQCWMTKNMNVGTRISTYVQQTQQFPEIIEKHCLYNQEEQCDTYGGHYQWDEMMQYSTTEGVQGICPGGWHIATDAEWCILENYVDSDTVDCGRYDYGGTDVGNKLKETGAVHWYPPNSDATNSSGFTALPAGYINQESSDERFFAYFWTSSNFWPGTASKRFLVFNYATIGRSPGQISTASLSVRCLKD